VPRSDASVGALASWLQRVTQPLPMKRFAFALLCCVVPGCSTDLSDDNASVFDDGDFGDAANAGAFEPGGDEQAMLRTCRPSNTVKGIDVSYYQRDIDWAAARADGVAYAFIRVSDGSNFVDPRFQDNWAGARV
jgi:lysozyme